MTAEVEVATMTAEAEVATMTAEAEVAMMTAEVAVVTTEAVMTAEEVTVTAIKFMQIVVSASNVKWSNNVFLGCLTAAIRKGVYCFQLN
jgi:hypothetical protein